MKNAFQKDKDKIQSNRRGYKQTPFTHLYCPYDEGQQNNIITKYPTDLNKQSQVHFAMQSMGRLINWKSFPEAVKIVKWMQIIMTSEFASNVVVSSLQRLENSINTFEEELDDGVELNKLTESSCIKTEKILITNPFLSIGAKTEIQISMTSGGLRSLNRKMNCKPSQKRTT